MCVYKSAGSRTGWGSNDVSPEPRDGLLKRFPARSSARAAALGGALLSMVLVAGCGGLLTQLGERPIVPGPLQPSLGAGAKTRDTTPPVPESAQTRITALPVAPAASAAPLPLAAPPSVAATEPVSVNLEQVPLGTFAQLVYADILKRNVNIDAQVLSRKELVTFRSGAAQPPAQLENAARQLLRTYNIAVVDLGNLVRIVPDTPNMGNLPELRRGSAALPDVPLSLRPVFQLVELQAVQQAEVSGWLRTMFGERIRVQEDVTRNGVLLSGSPDNMAAALEAVRVLDQPILRGVQSISITPVHWSADELARRLVEVLSAQGYAVQPLSQAPGGIRFPIVVLPVAGLNSVFVFARGEQVIALVNEWARRLDRPNEGGIGRNFFTYAVKHKDASALATTLEQLLGRTSTARVTSAGPAAAAAAPTSAARNTGVVVDSATNTLIFQSNPEEYQQITALLQTLDRPARAALIEVTVAELSLDDKSQLGVEWLTSQAAGDYNINAGTQGGLSIGTAGFNFRIFNSANALRFALNALASDNKATILSSPRVMARNGETATIQVGQEVPIVTSQQSTGATTGNIGTPQVLQTIQYRSTGVILKVKPVIHSSDQIDLDVSQEVSAAAATSTGVNNSPTFSTRKVDTKLTLRNGATVLLGGLISDESSRGSAGIPILKDIPWLGKLFGAETGSGTRRELVVLITPYIVNDNADAEAVTSAFRRLLGPWAGTVAADRSALPAAASRTAPPR